MHTSMMDDSSPHTTAPRKSVSLSIVTGVPPPPTHPLQAITMREALALYVSTHLTTLNDPGPSRSRIQHLSAFNDRTLESLTVVELQQFFNQLSSTNGPAAAYNTLKTLRHLYRKLIELQLYDGRVPAIYVRVKKPKARAVYLNERELADLAQVLADHPVMDRLFFTTLLTLFCRFGELRKARVEAFSFWLDRDTQQRRCLWRKGRTKNGRHHEVPLPPKLTEDLWHYLETRRRQDSPWLFPGRGMHPRTAVAWWSRWSEIRSDAGIDHVHIHDLRRTGSTWAVETTGDLTTVSKEGLQHADLTTTSIYVQSTGKKALQMFTAHEQALRAHEATPQPTAPHPSSEVSVPAVGAPVTTRPTRDDDDVMEWPG